MKKVLSFLAVFMILGILLQLSEFEKPYSRLNVVKAEAFSETVGDLNADNCIDVYDLTMVSLYLVGDMSLSEDQKTIADVDGDNQLTLMDLAKYHQFLTKNISDITDIIISEQAFNFYNVGSVANESNGEMANDNNGEINNDNINESNNEENNKSNTETTNNDNNTNETNNISQEKCNNDFDYVEWSSISVFEKVGVIGDSFASGEIYVNGRGRDYYNLSWIQILARKEGITAYNFSQGGLTTRAWLVEPTGLTKLLNTEKCGLYFLNLGINDSGRMGYAYLGTIADMHDDYTTNPDTFYGNYGKIIGYIKDKAPNAKLVMCTMPYNDDSHRRVYNGGIVNIAKYYGIPLIRTHELEFFKSVYFQNGLINGHPTATMYAGMANAYNKAFSDITVTNKEYFDDYIGIY